MLDVVICKKFDFNSPIPPRHTIELNGCISYALGFLSVTGAAGGTGKSSLGNVEEVSLAIGRDLFLPDRPALKCGRKRVWSMSLEDDETEHRRRFTATMRHYGISAADIDDHYRVTYKTDSPIEIARISGYDGVVISPQVDRIKRIIQEQRIDVVVVDPFVNTHQVPENDNGAMNKVADLWRSIAQECGVSIMLTHHIRKTNGTEVDAESLRGAVSLVAAARLVRVLATMSAKEAQTLSIKDDRRRFYFWVNPSAKANIAPPSASRVWYHMASVNLGNGDGQWDDDKVGVVESWQKPDSLDGVTGNHVQELARRLLDVPDAFLVEHCRKDPQARQRWIGYLIGEVVELDPDDESDRARIKRIVSEWLRAKVLEEVKIKGDDRKDKPCLRLGNSAKTVVIDL
jgi:hypothetical protein